MKRLVELELRDGIVAGDEAWAWWGLGGALATNGWSFLSDGERLLRHLRMIGAFAAIREGDIQLVEWSRPTSVTGWMNGVADSALTGHPVEWLDAALDGVVEHLDGRERYEPWTALGIRVDTEAVNTIRLDQPGLRGWAAERAHQFRRSTTADRWEQWVARADAYSALLAGITNPTTSAGGSGGRLDDGELAWLVSHPEQRGHLGFDDPAGGGIVVHTRIVRDGATLRYEHPAGDRQVLWMTVTLPDDLTGIEWLTLHRRLNFPVDMSVRATLVAPPDAAHHAEAAGVRASAHADYLRDMHRSIPPGLWQQIEELPQVADAIRRGQTPAIRPAIRFAIWADTKAELVERAVALRAVYADVGIGLHAPGGAEQPRLDLEALPASSVRHPAWGELMPAATFAASSFGLNPTVGDPGGPYMGTDLSTGRPFGFDPLARAVSSDSTLSVFLGILGSGKSVGSLLSCIWSFLRGASIIDMDPKGDSARIDRVLPAGAVQTISYGEGATAGAADPFVVTGRFLDAALVAVDIIRLLIPAAEYEAHRTAIIHACNAERDEATVIRPATMSGAVDRLRTTAPAVAGSLDAARGLRIARALFAEPDSLVEPFTIAGRWTRIAFPGLRLDDTDPGSLQAAVTTALLAAVGSAITEHCFASRSVGPKIVRWDEAHRVTRSAAGAQAIELMVREGRSYDVALQLVSQTWVDMPTSAKELAAAMFVFRTPHQGPAEEFCHALGIDIAHAGVLQSMPPGGGQALFRDAAGAVAHVQLDLVFSTWLQALKSDPTRTLAAEAA